MTALKQQLHSIRSCKSPPLPLPPTLYALLLLSRLRIKSLADFTPPALLSHSFLAFHVSSSNQSLSRWFSCNVHEPAQHTLSRLLALPVNQHSLNTHTHPYIAYTLVDSQSRTHVGVIIFVRIFTDSNVYILTYSYRLFSNCYRLKKLGFFCKNRFKK